MNAWIRTSLAVTGTMIVLAWLVVRPELLVVERIEFVGRQVATEAQLRHVADLRNGTTMWEVDLDRVSASVQRHPWVRRATAERRLPNTVVVRVDEHTPVALLAFDGALYLVDDRGTPFLRADGATLDLPVLTGIDPELEAAHPDLPRLVVRDALWLLRELDARKLLPSDQISEIAFHRTHGFVVSATGAVADRPSAEVLFGLGDYERQLRRLAALLDRGVDLSEPLHVDLGPVKVAIVRPLDAPVAFLSP